MRAPQLLLILLTFMSYSMSAQSLDSLGKDDDPMLTPEESAFLNKELKGQRKTFDFTEKKVLYITGASATNFLTKSDYFKELRKKKGTKAGVKQTLVVFTLDEIRDSGYDAMIMVAVNMLTDKRRKEIIKLLKKSREGS